MKLLRIVKPVFCVALLSAALTPGVKADAWDRKTVVTFSGPVEVPGVHLKGWGVLPAGTYVFKVLDSQSDRHIVQIFSQDEKTVYATVLAIPNHRLKATDKTVITFTERPAGQPEALRAWFYPGRNWGEEFVYPKARAIELAKAANTPVLFTAIEIPVEVAEPIKSADEPTVMVLKRTPILAIKPTGEEVQVAQVVTPPPAEETRAAAAPAVSPALASAVSPALPSEVEQERLPATASMLPLIGLFGLISLAGAFAVRAAMKRL